MPLRLETLFPVELERHLAVSPVLVLPFGTIEWHSHHLPVGLDGLVAQHMGELMADAMHAVLAPTGYWAVGGVPFPFTLNLPLTEVETLLGTALRQHAAMGFAVQVVFTGHFGLDQTLATKRAALRVMQADPRAIILPVTTYDLVADFYAGDHAGIGETSLLMALRPDLVRLDAWPAGETLPGVIGDDPRPTANAELGRRIFDESSSRAAALVTGFRTSQLHRADWIATLELVVGILETTRALRQKLGKEKVPAPTTPDYLQGCAALAQGRFSEAQVHFRTKAASLERLPARS
ncbi:MAG: creatininase family protein [Burkholderiales bacterium]|nr:creatininase family protein [Opitutaceae bacterium]